ncbi:type VII toxin-antitoxin system MntA family adenylyltransferase antitoxin [Thermodesulfobacterium hydrogeniphilum]|uniref:type VII toxin-antitoxin system MntA family adenylyltransferase antitoxin n=1 Tax=Thermodesulfobacterium hydrogeniphilum TaxID=161156 RepID=UPI00068B1530|nr:nucleotidyltransferase domain-containing protein [Thermodesulfobacterium hydrogeniphilum]
MPHQTQGNLENIFRKIKDFLEKDPNIVFALVFGSAATGKLRKDSDIDVAIYVKNPVSEYELLSLMQKLSDLIKREVEIVVLNEVSPLLRHQVMKNRKELFIKDFLVYSKFRENTIDDYQEYLDITGYSKYVD